jgi:hypothetical protein
MCLAFAKRAMHAWPYDPCGSLRWEALGGARRSCGWRGVGHKVQVGLCGQEGGVTVGVSVGQALGWEAGGDGGTRGVLGGDSVRLQRQQCLLRELARSLAGLVA